MYHEDQRFHGLEGLALNNADEDPSYLKDLAGMEVYRLAGSPYARVGYAQLFVNGLDKGLMLVVEPTDDRWMRRSFGRTDGNLYDGTYAFNGWTPYFLDVGDGRDEAFDLLEGEDVGAADIGVLSAAVEATREDGDLARVSALLDVHALSALLAAEWFIGNADGYGSYSNNYRLYLPSGGRAVLAPWDMGATFPPDGRDDTLWERPNGNLAELCSLDPACGADQDARRDALVETVAASDLPDTLVAVRAHIRAAAEGDPVGVCDAARVAEAQEGLLAWFNR
jgi:spore coat protein CotH